jgi:hypothetical protein
MERAALRFNLLPNQPSAMLVARAAWLTCMPIAPGLQRE